MIKFDKVSFRYGTAPPVFENRSFTIPEGSITMLLGANGAGKTTLLKCLTNQLRPYSGTISINGVTVSDLSNRDIAKLIAYVPQGLDRNADFTVLDFVVFGRTPYLGLFESPSDDDYNIAVNHLKANDILHLQDKSINEISGGERQLAYITRALIQDTPIIIMDEPMSALDFTNQAKMLKVIMSLSERGKTIILTSHNPNHALSISSDILLIDKDMNILFGKAEDMLTNNDILSKAFGDQVKCINNSDFPFVTFSIQ